MFKLALEKAEEPEIKLPTSAGSWKKQESSRKTFTSTLLGEISSHFCERATSLGPEQEFLGPRATPGR